MFDDFGTPSVTVFDDDGTVCTLNGPPYSCTWQPTGADVGRATLLASAVDADRRSSLGSVRVRVAKFEADLTSKRRGRKVTGRLVLPQAVEKALGCQGEVTVRRKKVRRTVEAEAQLHVLGPPSARQGQAEGAVRGQLGGRTRHLDSTAP